MVWYTVEVIINVFLGFCIWNALDLSNQCLSRTSSFRSLLTLYILLGGLLLLMSILLRRRVAQNCPLCQSKEAWEVGVRSTAH